MEQLKHIFVIGAARSGTKLVRDVLATGDRCAAVPYDISFIWRYGNESHPDDELSTQQCNEKISGYIRKNVASIALTKNQGADTVIEKTVGNTLRVDFVNAIYPDCLFIHLVRDGRSVIESSYRQWQAPVEWSYTLRKAKSFPWRNLRYAVWYAGNVFRGLFSGRKGVHLWGPRYKNIERDVENCDLVEVCTRQWVECVSKAESSFSRINPSRVLEIRYEDFVKDPSCLETIIEFTKLSEADTIRRNFAAVVKPDLPSRWETTFTEQERSRILAEIEPVMSRLKYR